MPALKNIFKNLFSIILISAFALFALNSSFSVYAEEVDYSKEYFTITWQENGKFGIGNTQTTNTKEWSDLAYSIDGEEWVDITSESTAVYSNAPTVNVTKGQKVRFRANINKDGRKAIGTFRFNLSGSCELSGNIMSLYCGGNGASFSDATEIAYKYAFASLFGNCGSVKSITNLVLPATKVSEGAYYYMFASTKLTTIPWNLLPATELGAYCYFEMFYRVYLTTFCNLPATVLPEACYYRMFSGAFYVYTSETKDDYYSQEFRINVSDPESIGKDALSDFCSANSGSLKTVETNKTYYILVKKNFEIDETKQTKEYTGSRITYDITGRDASKMTGISYRPSDSQNWYPNVYNPGTYDVKILCRGLKEIYDAEVTIEGGLVITPHEISITWEPSDITYDGTEKTKVASLYCYLLNDGNEVKHNLNYKTISYPTEEQKFRNAGDYVLEAILTTINFNCYTLTTEKTYTFTIKPIEIEATWTEKTYTYNGEVQEIPVTIEYPGKEAEQATYTVDKGEFKNAGTYTVTAISTDSNYKIKDELSTHEYTISKVKVNEPTIDVSSFEFDNTEKEAVLNGLESYMIMSLDSVNKATNAGTYTITFELDPNYEWNEDNDGVLTWTITKAKATEPIVTTPSFAYTRREQEVTITGAESYMTMSLDSVTKAKDIGTYTITYTLDPNYEWIEGSDGALTWEIVANNQGLSWWIIVLIGAGSLVLIFFLMFFIWKAEYDKALKNDKLDDRKLKAFDSIYIPINNSLSNKK